MNWIQLNGKVSKLHPELTKAQKKEETDRIWAAIKAGATIDEETLVLSGQTPQPLPEKKEAVNIPDSGPVTFASREDFMAAIKDVVKGMMPTNPPKSSIDHTDDDDFSEEAFIFFAYDHSHTCFNDRRNGRIVDAPEPIRFVHSYRYPAVGQSIRDSRMVNLSIFKTHSRASAKWIREHTMFKVRYFEEIENANNDDALEAQARVNIANGISMMSTHALIEKAKSLPGVEVTADVPALRLQVIQALTKLEISKNKERQNRIVRETNDFIKTAGVTIPTNG